MRILISILLLSFNALGAIKSTPPKQATLNPQNDIEYLRAMVLELKEKQKILQVDAPTAIKTRVRTEQKDISEDSFENLESKYFDDVTTKSAAPKKRNQRIRSREK